MGIVTKGVNCVLNGWASSGFTYRLSVVFVSYSLELDADYVQRTCGEKRNMVDVILKGRVCEIRSA